MTSRDDLAWATVTPRKCRRHEWVRMAQWVESGVAIGPFARCERCGKEQDVTVSRRGLNNRKRGNSIERDVAKTLGLRRVGQFGGAADAGESTDPFVASVKSGSGYFSERYWDQLKRLPVHAQQTAILVVTDAPGPGHRRRAVVVLDLADWVALHGPAGVEDVA